MHVIVTEASGGGRVGNPCTMHTSGAGHKQTALPACWMTCVVVCSSASPNPTRKKSLDGGFMRVHAGSVSVRVRVTVAASHQTHANESPWLDGDLHTDTAR